MGINVHSLVQERPPIEVPIFPVVRIRPRSGKSWGPTATGFLVNLWESFIITARHVVAPSGIRPSLVRIVARTLTGKKEVVMDGSSVAYDDNADPDVAVVRVVGTFSSRLVPLPEDQPAELPVQIWGYPGKTARLKKIDSSLAAPLPPWIQLRDSGLQGMSGGPVLYNNPKKSEEPEPRGVIGIYLGTKDLAVVAYPLDSTAVHQCTNH